MPAPRQRLDQLARARQRLDLVEPLLEQLALELAQLIAVLALGLLAGERGDDLIAAHADVAVAAPGGDLVAVAGECPLPGQRVLVDGVDQGSVDVEESDLGHGRALPASRARNRGADR